MFHDFTNNIFNFSHVMHTLTEIEMVQQEFLFNDLSNDPVRYSSDSS